MKPVFIVAELSANHGHRLETALESLRVPAPMQSNSRLIRRIQSRSNVLLRILW